MFVKLDCGMLRSTIWRETSDTRIVWVTMLMMKNRNGFVEATIPNIADEARVSIEAANCAIKILESPDGWSRNEGNEGRRIKKIEGGYFIFNHEYYRIKDHTASERQRRHREMSRIVTPVTRDVTKRSVSVSVSDNITNIIRECREVWLSKVHDYMVRYPNLDYNFQWDLIEQWMKDNPRKAMKRSNWNLFIMNWLSKVRPSFSNRRPMRVAPNREETKDEKISHLTELVSMTSGNEQLEWQKKLDKLLQEDK